jgi:hypothetical protein
MTTPEPTGQEVEQRRPESKVPVQLGVRVTDLDTAYRAAQAIAMSNLCPEALQGKPADVLMIIMYGTELGLSIIQSIQGIIPIKGRITMSAELRVGLTGNAGYLTGVACGRIVDKDGATVIRCGEFAHADVHRGPQADHRYQEDHDLTRCRYRVESTRTGAITFGEFTQDDALRAHLLVEGTGEDAGKLISRKGQYKTPQPWELYGRDMLWNRAAARACRRAAPQVGYGLYTEEEAEEIAAREPIRADAVVDTQPVAEEPPGDPAADADDLRAMEAEHANGGV